MEKISTVFNANKFLVEEKRVLKLNNIFNLFVLWLVKIAISKSFILLKPILLFFFYMKQSQTFRCEIILINQKYNV